VGQYFSNEILPSNIKSYNAKILGHAFTFFTDNGVFSKEHLDFGTRLLLENIPLELVTGDILDVGCGYGVIGITLAKLTKQKVTMIDINKRALHLASKNAKENKIENFDIRESNCYENILASEKFQIIVTNPPIRAGKKIVYEILMKAKDHLIENGSLFLVIRKEQGAKSLISDLKECYDVEVLEKKKGFFILKCTFWLTSWIFYGNNINWQRIIFLINMFFD